MRDKRIPHRVANKANAVSSADNMAESESGRGDKGENRAGHTVHMDKTVSAYKAVLEQPCCNACGNM